MFILNQVWTKDTIISQFHLNITICYLQTRLSKVKNRWNQSKQKVFPENLCFLKFEQNKIWNVYTTEKVIQDLKKN